jgi:Helix-turn-helix domain
VVAAATWRAAGERVRRERESKLGSRALAALVGPSVSTWQKIEDGQGGRCSPTTLARVSRALGWTDSSLYDLGTRGTATRAANAEVSANVLYLAQAAARLPANYQRFVGDVIRFLGELVESPR